MASKETPKLYEKSFIIAFVVLLTASLISVEKSGVAVKIRSCARLDPSCIDLNFMKSYQISLNINFLKPC